jgi:uncharacterized protein (DUF697 family)
VNNLRWSSSSIDHRPSFLRGSIVGIALVAVKLFVVLPIDIADFLYATCLLITLVISIGELFGWRVLSESDALDFVLGILLPLDSYAVLILYGLPLPD